MKLLVSVVDVGEARAAAAAGADIVDVKNPAEGSLGAPSPAVIAGVRAAVPAGLPVSAAIGDMPNLPGTAALATLGAARSGATFVKVGLWGVSTEDEAVVLLRTVRDAVADVPGTLSAIALADSAPDDAWETVTWATGTAGPLTADFCALRVRPTAGRGDRWLLCERSATDVRKYYLLHLPATTPLVDLVALARSRWPIEQQYRELKDDLGLDHCEARSWHGWHRHVSLCLAAAAFLAKLAADLPRTNWDRENESKANERSPATSAAA